MPKTSRIKQSRTDNRAKGNGRPPKNNVTLSSNGNNSSNSNNNSDEDVLFHKFSELNLDFKDFKAIYEDEEDEIVVFEQNSINYESEICDKFESLLLEIDAVNEEIINEENNQYSDDNLFKGVTPQFGVRQGCGSIMLFQ